MAAGPGVVIERDSPGAAWRFSRQPLPEAQNISALAAIRAGPEVRALVSVDLAKASNPNSNKLILESIDNLLPPGFGQPPGLVGPDPLPYTGYLLEETAEGWRDLERQAYPSVRLSPVASDLPGWPDPVLALDVDPSGSRGWAVGGETGDSPELPFQEINIETAAALRLGPGPPPPQSGRAAIPTPQGQATFAVAGNAQCEEPCTALEDKGLGPEAWLSGAVSTAARIPGLRAFLYTGARVAGASGGLGSPWELKGDAFSRELRSYAGDLSGAGSLPVRVAASPSDVFEGGLSSFASVLGPDAPVGSSPAASPSPPPGAGAYAFDSGAGAEGVRVIVLDDTRSELREGELSWLAGELDAARGSSLPAIVIGNAADESAVDRVLLEHGASAYFYDSRNENRVGQIGSGSNVVPVFGTGTLGYVPPHRARRTSWARAAFCSRASISGRAILARTARP